ncbi:MAG: aminopeptidase [Lachnospiraceae bacterium]|nr:aminopeptidase [Lachnospiraceae bacterium]
MCVETEVLEERYALAMERIAQIAGECVCEEAFADYFTQVAQFLLALKQEREFVEGGGLKSASEEELIRRNTALYADVLPAHYAESYADPAYAVHRLGKVHGQMLSMLYCEMRSMIPFVYEHALEELVIRLELFVEVYVCYVYAQEEGGTAVQRQQAETGAEQTVLEPAGGAGLPAPEDVRQILYWYASDYAEIAAETHLRQLLLPEGNFAVDIIRHADLTDTRYLYAYGEYVSENERETARFLASLSQEQINVMADTYTEGYRIGFAVTGKDLSKKKTVEIRYQIGFERMMRRAVENFAKMGLGVTCYRAATSILYNPTLHPTGYYGGAVNRQYRFDHKDDKALILDKQWMHHKLEVTRTAFERLKEAALGYAGPAVVETFGEHAFSPKNKDSALQMSAEQNALWVEYRTQAGALQRQYILEEERSFTIIAFPVPEIRDAFDAELVQSLGMQSATQVYHAFFADVIRINTLDYQRYRKIQQTLIDVLDTADYCEIKGMNGNRTALKVNLWKLSDPARETIFENCVADVNIPVGEVFTSPVLQGTEGVLHVREVYLNGLAYHDLELRFADGCVQDYTCANFETEEEKRTFIRENVLFRHKTLPMGEFAIGTNTTAYAVARKYRVQDKMPILIAEKTGPHFAVGDTCYSHVEEVRVYNPDGKEIVARDNEVARLRDKAPEKAYFNCHTDITIPYDELGALTAVRRDGSRIDIIRTGRFVLAGTEELNEALQEEAVKN